MKKPITLKFPHSGPKYERFLKEQAKLDAEAEKKKEKERKRLAKLCTCCPIHGSRWHRYV